MGQVPLCAIRSRSFRGRPVRTLASTSQTHRAGATIPTPVFIHLDKGVIHLDKGVAHGTVFQTDDNPPLWTRVYFDMAAPENVQDSTVVAPEEADVDRARYFPRGCLFDPAAFRRETAGYPADGEVMKRIDIIQTRFKEAITEALMKALDDLTKTIRAQSAPSSHVDFSDAQLGAKSAILLAVRLSAIDQIGSDAHGPDRLVPVITQPSAVPPAPPSPSRAEISRRHAEARETAGVHCVAGNVDTIVGPSKTNTLPLLIG